MKILAVGDTHGDSLTVRAALDEAEGRADWVVQVGDFGYWEHTREGVRFLDTCNTFAAEAEVPIVFLDGNHENHPLLWERYSESDKTPEGFWTIRPNVFYAPRGHRWVWDTRRFLALGGAYSIDRYWRKLGDSYWLTEEITNEEADNAAAGGPVDVMFTHDAPLSVHPTANAEKNLFPETSANRAKIEKVVEATRPSLLVHGHWHVRYSDTFEHRDGYTTRVEGLAADGRPGTTLWLSTGEV